MVSGWLGSGFWSLWFSGVWVLGFGFRVLGLRHVCLLWGFVGQQGPCSGFSRFKALG